MRHGIRLTVGAVTLSMIGAGCVATRDWTRDLLAKRHVDVNEHLEQVETDVREQGHRLGRVETRVAELDTRLGETRDLVRTALPRPAEWVEVRTTTSDDATPPARTVISIVNVPFGFDSADLDGSAREALASILTELREHPHMTIDLEGATDPVGRLDYNVRLSERRVEAVKKWLMKNGLDRSRIVGARARGPVADPSISNDLKRRVMVRMMSASP